jgi:hypothetical protein
MKQINLILLLACIAAFIPLVHQASAQDGKNFTSVSEVSSDTRYGLFGQYDRRSAYGEGKFPEPFLIDDTDLERNEVRFDWLHTTGPGSGTQNDVLHAEFEKSFGLMTFEIELPYVKSIADGVTTKGLDNLDLGARYPLYMYVSKSGFINSTFGASLEVGVPFYNQVSVNTEIVPKVFNDMTIGKHFSVQSLFGWSSLLGRAPEGGLQSAEYGFVFGYTLQHKEVPIPGVMQLVPIFELKGGKTLTQENSGANELIADIGCRVNLKPIYGIQPRIGMAYVFPLDSGGRQVENSGFVISTVFEY